ncbi:MAG: hypothetical protein Q7S55_02685 [Nanoarchaeota archaeon]|nr:hypothetical protein [Nanoarchaeota archaeon]
MSKIGRNGVIIILMAVLLLIVSCLPQTKTAESANITPTEVSIDGCAPQWECADENYKVQVLENCTRVSPTKCERGCVDGECRPAEVCTVGFKCIDENRKGYQKEDCSFATKTDCEWGCAAGKCKEKPTNVTNTSVTNTTTTTSGSGYSAIAENAEENETVPEGPLYTLQLGEEAQIEIDGAAHTIKIYNLEVDRVIIKIDEIKSDWITEGGSFTYGNLETTVTIKSILFQAYGKKEIEYILS